MEKYCKKCDTTKPVSEFYKSSKSKDGLNTYCRQCKNQMAKGWYKNNKERAKKNTAAWNEKNPDYHVEWRKSNPDYHKEWREKNPDKVKATAERSRPRKIERTYGITIEHYNDLLDQQNNRCAICREENANGRSLSIDHDHSCCPGNKSCGNCVRQLLCDVCNRGLGFFKDNPELLREAANYLERHSRPKFSEEILD